MCSKEKRIGFGVFIIYLLIVSCVVLYNNYSAKLEIAKTILEKNKYQVTEIEKSQVKVFRGNGSIFTPFDEKIFLKNISSFDNHSNNRETNSFNDGTKKVQIEEIMETTHKKEATDDQKIATKEIHNVLDKTKKFWTEKKAGTVLNETEQSIKGEIVKSYDTTDLLQCIKQTSHSLGNILDDSTLNRLIDENCEVAVLKGNRCYKIYPKERSDKPFLIQTLKRLNTDDTRRAFTEKDAVEVLHSRENYNEAKVVKSVNSLLQCTKQAKVFNTTLDDIVLFRSLYEICDVTILGEENCYKVHPKKIQQDE